MSDPSNDPLEQIAWPIRTDRLTVRRVTADDAEATWRYRRLPEVGEWIGWYTTDRDEYGRLFADPARLASVLVIELDGEVIGDVVVRGGAGFAQREVADQAAGTQYEVGWSLHPAHGRHGYATEAVRAVVDEVFATLGAHRVHAYCYADNSASWRLMERLGMRREAHTRRSDLHRCGRWLDAFQYAVLHDEWPAADARS